MSWTLRCDDCNKDMNAQSLIIVINEQEFHFCTLLCMKKFTEELREQPKKEKKNNLKDG